jgi:hypothetical protein
MLLAGMDLDILHTHALLSGIVFLVPVGILWAPVAHGLLHHLHLDGGGEK